MKIKLDENMPDGLQTSLGWLGHDVDTAVQEGLAGKLDPQVWTASQAEGRFLVTQDLDFSDLRAFIATSITAFSSSDLRIPRADS